MPWDIFYSIYKCLRIVEKWTTFFFFLCRNHLICTIAMFFRQLIVDYEQLYLCSRSLCSSKSKTGEVLLVHNYNKIILSGRKICGTWYLMNQLRYIRVSDSWRIWNTVRIKLFHHDEKGMEDLIYSSNFSVRCYLSLIQKNSRTFLACFIISFYTELIPKKTFIKNMYVYGRPTRYSNCCMNFLSSFLDAISYKYVYINSFLSRTATLEFFASKMLPFYGKFKWF